MVEFFEKRFVNIGSLLVGVSGSWLGGCLFWGWLRAFPVWHLPVESIALPIACFGLFTRLRVGAGFYLASLLGTAFTDLMILFTGVMKSWPEVVNASFQTASDLLHQTALNLLSLEKILLLILAGACIAFIARFMNQRAAIDWLLKKHGLLQVLLLLRLCGWMDCFY